MFKTIFNKMTSVFIAITIFSFSVGGVLLYYFLGRSVVGDMAATLTSTAENLNTSLSIYRENWPGDINAALKDPLISNNLISYSQNTGSIIWIVDKDGRLIKSAYYKTWDFMTNTPLIQFNKFIYESGRTLLPETQMYKKVMTGNYDIVEEKGDFYGMFADTGKTWLTIETPIKYKDSAGKSIVEGAIFIHAPIPQILEARSGVFRFFIIAVIVALLISITLVYFAASRITKPLNKIAGAARVIARGDFAQKIEINSKDEVGELARSFNNMAAELQNHEETRREFIANVSHELRTPMTSIRGFVEGILDGTVPENKINTYLAIVRDEISRMSRMVNDLLDLSKMEAGELKLVFKKVNLNELIRRCIIRLENLFEKKNLYVDVSFEEEVLNVSADPDAIERVVTNLLHNAVKFTPLGGQITVRTYTQKNKAYVSVKDNGVGIAEEDLALIWKRFYKTDKSRSEDKKGTGLGLAIVKSLMNEHKQDVWAISQVGKGTEFIFTLDRINVE
ncbi:MAG: ATP-binding protein [Eubacteriales bacterium]|nr:ATP-binding protein [Eubacteriales bacterium]